MSPELSDGDTWLSVKRHPSQPYKVGDILVFIPPGPPRSPRYSVKRLARHDYDDRGHRYWLLGTVGHASLDSTQYGWVNHDQILGRLCWRLMR